MNAIRKKPLVSNRKLFMIGLVGFIGLAAIYLFAEAPSPLGDAQNKNQLSLSVEDALKIVARENDMARMLYTKSIVGQGKAAGLKFSEHWQDNDVEAGPLPALFLRSTSNFLERDRVPLGLYLGSDFPIVRENLFSGIQQEKFSEIRKDEKARFFYDESIERYTAIFPDYASAQACVTCHNEHPDSPKTDWKLNDMMGGTTWTYPKDSLSTEEVLDIIRAFREGAVGTYQTYLDKTKTFKDNPIPLVGNNWPGVGVYELPSVEVFKDSVNRIAAEQTLISILQTAQK